MLNIYKLTEENGDIKPIKMDTWDNGKFGKLSKEMSREQVIDVYNRGYYFTSEVKEEK